MLTVLASLVFTQCSEDSCAHRSPYSRPHVGHHVGHVRAAKPVSARLLCTQIPVLPPSCWSPRRPRTRGQTCLRTRAPSPQSSSRHSPPSPRLSSSTTSARPPPPPPSMSGGTSETRPRHVPQAWPSSPSRSSRAGSSRPQAIAEQMRSDTHCQTRPALRCAREASAAVERRLVARVLTHAGRRDRPPHALTSKALTSVCTSVSSHPQGGPCGGSPW